MQLHNLQQGAAVHVLQLKQHQGGGLTRVVNGRVHRIRMPAKRKHPLRLNPLNLDVPQQVLVTLKGNLPLSALASDKTLALQRHAKPLAKGFGIGHHPPHGRARYIEQDLSFDAI